MVRPNVTPPYRVVASIKNNRLWQAIVTRYPQVPNQRQAALVLQVRESELGKLLNMKLFPARWDEAQQQWIYRKIAQQLSDQLYQPVEYLFDPTLYRQQVPSRLEVCIGLHALTGRGQRMFAPSAEALVFQEAIGPILDNMLAQLTPREERIVRGRLGLDGVEKTYDELAQEELLSRERVRQLYERGIVKLQHPSRTKRLRDALES